MKPGKLIVIEGTDGSGKGTQCAMLLSYLTQNGIPCESFDFPQYDKTFFGSWVGQFLQGKFGPHQDIPPYIISIPYAADRWQAKDAIAKSLGNGKIVVINRYATSNAAFQGAKLSPAERADFIAWNFQMEYEEFGIPKEDCVIYLRMPIDVSQKLIETKARREYLSEGQTKDVYEADVKFQSEVSKAYDQLSQDPHWVTIDCADGNSVLSKDVIHERIVVTLEEKGIIRKTI